MLGSHRPGQERAARAGSAAQPRARPTQNLTYLSLGYWGPGSRSSSLDSGGKGGLDGWEGVRQTPAVGMVSLADLAGQSNLSIMSPRAWPGSDTMAEEHQQQSWPPA